MASAGYCRLLPFLLLLLGEATADRQQFVFQTEKYKLKNANKPLGKYSKGFIDTGLWSLLKTLITFLRGKYVVVR